MMDLLTWMEMTVLGTWVRESVSLWAYPGMLSFHTIGLGFVVGASVAVDLRLLGYAPTLSLSALEKFLPVIWVGFWINAISGLLLLLASASGLMTNAIFVIKMAFVVLGIVFVRVIKMRVFDDPAVAKSGVIPKQGRVLARLSIAWWVLALILGRLTAYPLMIHDTFGWEI